MTTTVLLMVASLIASLVQETGPPPPQSQTFEPPRQRAQTILVSELDPDLSALPVGDWLRSTVQSDRELQWITTACPATHEKWVDVESDRPVCVLITASQHARPGPERPQVAAKGELVAAISVRLGRGNPNNGPWMLERPIVEDAFIERDGDSLTVQKLGDMPRLLQLSPEQWPKADLSVRATDIHCDNSHPKPGDKGRCRAIVRNSGSLEAVARIGAWIAAAGADLGTSQLIGDRKIPAHGQVAVAWEWVWPPGDAWSVGVRTELLTPHAWGGYRTRIKEPNQRDNGANVTVRARR